HVEALDVPIPAAMTPERLAKLAVQHGIGDLPIFCEVRLDDALATRLRQIQAAGFGAKVRCGGMLADAYPSGGQLARFLVESAGVGVAFKATAGLHHPVCGVRDEHNGATMHGFLNVMVGTALARRGAQSATIVPILECTDTSAFGYDGQTLRFRDDSFSETELSDLRSQAFTSYGSCSFQEPVSDLQQLGMVKST
ncbi:MAG: hypothetical protein ACYDA1_05085, partial [Vulcanimicrobiaceae bacterium]